MFEFTTRRLGFRKRFVWFAERAYDIPACDGAYFFATDRGAEHADPGFQCHGTPTLVLDLSQDTNTLFSDMKPKCRNKVRKAEKTGISIAVGAHASEFKKLYRGFVKQKNLDDDIRNLSSFLFHGRLYTAWFDGRLLAGLLTIEDDRQARWLLSGSTRLKDDRGASGSTIGHANRLLVWRAAVDCHDRGLQTFDLGGLYEGSDSNDPRARIAQFKREFGGTRVVRYRCVKLYNPIYRALKVGRDRLSRPARRAADLPNS